ncbi:MAG TPA: D-alanine--D-alanine ligase family protein [Thermoanaerobaculia bacterium]|nr:D-alanine--D-alanine ligase family protein [Thermoanaerobaculia bacterium]
MSRTRVVVLFGGRSVEREVSRISARTICGALDPSRYDVIPLAVTADGRFLSAGESAKRLTAKGVPERFLPGSGAAPAGESVVPSEIAPGRADVVFPIIHGTTGEDGVLQGFLETLGLPYVGAGVAASAVGMDKAVFKALLRDAGIPSARSAVFAAPPAAGARAPFDVPFFVKPANGGSSVGVVKVKRTEDWAAAVANALRYDERALAEEAIDARELECAVLGNDQPKASIVGEIVPGHEFYDYDDKYRDDKAKLVIPAAVSDAVSAEVRRLSVEVFRLCGASGMARVDFFLERGTDRVLVNEINTLPGFTAISMYPKLWEATGVPLPRLLDELIRLAIERRDRRARLLTEPPAELA